MENKIEKPISLFTPEVTQEIQKRLVQVEVKRLKMIKQTKTTWFVFLIIITVLALFLLVLQNENLYIPFGVIAGLSLVVALIITYGSRSRLAAEFKLSVLIPSIKKGKSELNYSHNSSITKQEFRKSQIFRSNAIDRYNGEDLFTGVRGKTAYKFSEVHAEEEHETTDSDGNTTTYYTTIFKGIFMIADFNKHLKSSTRVIQGGDGFFEKLFAGKSKVTLENPTFESIFNTYSRDQVEARYILSPAMMERILELKNRFKTTINLCFKDNHVFIAVSSGQNHFEPDISEELGMNQVERIFKEIESCLSIIDTLDLNTRIWTKK